MKKNWESGEKKRPSKKLLCKKCQQLLLMQHKWLDDTCWLAIIWLLSESILTLNEVKWIDQHKTLSAIHLYVVLFSISLSYRSLRHYLFTLYVLFSKKLTVIWRYFSIFLCRWKLADCSPKTAMEHVKSLKFNAQIRHRLSMVSNELIIARFMLSTCIKLNFIFQRATTKYFFSTQREGKEKRARRVNFETFISNIF